ncbi:nuclear matrix constituent protein 1a-like isoform X2 [Prosopis cineraria]|uniref:nuclear matrix constituent protein 1a-like isoform X2 n=1 Tax=Prosopis cineraria TaxID=364024 RepID=UPI00240EC9AD|nr:nuclear matrix constituent protein 1a-like isoform X2 [Prosopis cineraria]
MWQLECLFSIPKRCKLPKLVLLDIEDAPQLGQVFECEQAVKFQELTMKDVLPKLIGIRLVNLSSLHTIYHELDFQNVEIHLVRQCPNISITSANDSEEELYALPMYLEDDDDYHYAGLVRDWAFEIEEEEYQNIIEQDSAKPEHTNTSSNLKNSSDASKNEIVEEQLSNSHTAATSSSNLDMEVEATVGEGLLSERCDANNETIDARVHGRPKSEEVVISNEVKDSELRTMPAPFASPLQVESAQTKEIVEETSVLRSQKSKEAVLADEVMESKLSNIPSPFSSPLQSEYPQELKESMAVQQAIGESRSFCEASQRVDEPTNQSSSKETSISSPKKPQMEIPATQADLGNLKSDLLHISAITESAQEKIMNQPETSTEEEIMLDHRNSQKFAEDDLMRLFQIMEEGHIPHVSKISVREDASDVTKALFDLEDTLKMSLNEIASSEESRLRLENALNILSSHCSADGPPSHGLQTTIHSLQLEIQTVVSSFNQAYATIDTFNKLEQKEKLIHEERSQRKEAAIALLSVIDNTESSLTEAQLKEAELKEKISKLQDELYSKVKEIEEYEIKLSSLKEQKKKSVSDTMGFIKEFETVKKERSHMMEDHMKAEQQLQNMNVKWSCCLSNLKKTALLLEVHLQQKL